MKKTGIPPFLQRTPKELHRGQKLQIPLSCYKDTLSAEYVPRFLLYLCGHVLNAPLGAQPLMPSLRFKLLACPPFPAQGSSTTSIFVQGKLSFEQEGNLTQKIPSVVWSVILNVAWSKGLKKGEIISEAIVWVPSRTCGRGYWEDWPATNEKRIEQRHGKRWGCLEIRKKDRK